jgi:hypothetical protein
MRETGFAGCLTKPVKPEQLKDKLDQWLTRSHDQLSSNGGQLQGQPQENDSGHPVHDHLGLG